MLIRILPLLLCCLCCTLPTTASLAAKPAPTPADFEVLVPLTLEKNTPMHLVPLSPAIYAALQKTSIRDLRIFDAQGKAMPCCFNTPKAVTQEDTQNYPAHPVRVGFLKNGGFVLLQSPANTEEKAVDPEQFKGEGQGFLFSFGEIPVSFASLQVVPTQPLTPKDGQGQLISVNVYGSKDLSSWHHERSTTSLGKLHTENQVVEQLSLSVSSEAWNYLLIVPQQGVQLFALRELQGVLQSSTPAPMEETLVEGIWDEEGKGYAYRLAASMRIRGLRMETDSKEYYFHAEIFTRQPLSEKRRPSQKILTWQWHSDILSTSLIHDQSQPPTVSAPAPFSSYWLNHARRGESNVLLRPADGPWEKAPVLRVFWEPQELHFLSKGTPPYSLALISKRAGLAGDPDNRVLSLNNALPCGIATLGEPSVPLDTASKPASPSKKSDAPGPFIWIALLIGALCMGGMAFSMLRGKDKEPPNA